MYLRIILIFIELLFATIAYSPHRSSVYYFLLIFSALSFSGKMSFFGVSTINRINTEAQKLSMYLVRVKDVLENAEKKQITDPSLKERLEILKEGEYMVQDMLAEVAINSNLLKETSPFNPMNIILRRNMGKRLNELKGRLNELEERWNRVIPEEVVIANDMSVEVAGQTSLIQRRHR
jgi:hypothetical protein